MKVLAFSASSHGQKSKRGKNEGRHSLSLSTSVYPVWNRHNVCLTNHADDEIVRSVAAILYHKAVFWSNPLDLLFVAISHPRRYLHRGSGAESMDFDPGRGVLHGLNCVAILVHRFGPRNMRDWKRGLESNTHCTTDPSTCRSNLDTIDSLKIYTLVKHVLFRSSPCWTHWQKEG